MSSISLLLLFYLFLSFTTTSKYVTNKQCHPSEQNECHTDHESNHCLFLQVVVLMKKHPVICWHQVLHTHSDDIVNPVLEIRAIVLLFLQDLMVELHSLPNLLSDRLCLVKHCLKEAHTECAHFTFFYRGCAHDKLVDLMTGVLLHTRVTLSHALSVAYEHSVVLSHCADQVSLRTSADPNQSLINVG